MDEAAVAALATASLSDQSVSEVQGKVFDPARVFAASAVVTMTKNEAEVSASLCVNVHSWKPSESK